MGCSQSALTLPPPLLSRSLSLIPATDRPLFINESSRGTHPSANRHPSVYYSTWFEDCSRLYILSAGALPVFRRGWRRSKRGFGSKGDPSNLNDGDETAEEGRVKVTFSSLPGRRKIQERERKNKIKKLERRELQIEICSNRFETKVFEFSSRISLMLNSKIHPLSVETTYRFFKTKRSSRIYVYIGQFDRGIK